MSENRKTVNIYTDGACSGNPGPGGWAAILKYGAHTKEMSGGYRLTTNNRMEIMAAWKQYAAKHGMKLEREGEGHRFTVVSADGEGIIIVKNPEGAIPCETIQKFLDDFLSRHPNAGIDFIHGEGSLRALAGKPGVVGFLLPEIDKHSFFEDVKKLGVLPRKTFSMGEADEKRFYMEAKKI